MTRWMGPSGVARCFFLGISILTIIEVMPSIRAQKTPVDNRLPELLGVSWPSRGDRRYRLRLLLRFILVIPGHCALQSKDETETPLKL